MGVAGRGVKEQDVFYRCVVVPTGLFVRFHTLRRHRRQYGIEEEALEWIGAIWRKPSEVW